MSRQYFLKVHVEGFDWAKRYDIESAIEEARMGDGVQWYRHEGRYSSLSCEGEVTIGGGQSEDDAIDALIREAWKANGKPCEVTTWLTYLEDGAQRSAGPDDLERLGGAAIFEKEGDE